ncbi:MAG: CHAT domain-containing tetratricopeptide repeat protein [Thermodesulfobacteriota bacterium]
MRSRRIDEKAGSRFQPLSCLILLGFLLCSMLPSCAGGGYRQYAVSLTQPASTAEGLVAAGDYTQAIAMYQKAYLDYEKEKNDLGMLLCLEKMGWLKRELGDYGGALELFRKAHPIGLRLNGDAAEIDADLGDVYFFSGDSEKAGEYYLRSLTTLKDFVFPTSFGRPPSQVEISTLVRKSTAVIHARVNLGTMHYFAGQYAGALKNLKIADEVIQRILTVEQDSLYGMFFKAPPEMHEGIGYCQTITAATFGEMGRFDEAFKYFEAGKKAFERGQKPFGLLINQALWFKIEFLSPGYKIDSAHFDQYERFLETANRFGALEVVWRMCFEIGRALVKEKEYPKAREYLARAIDALELTRSRLREDTIKKMFAASVQDVYAEMIRLLYIMKLYEEGFDYLERAKARAFLDLLAGRALKEKTSVDPLLIKKERELQQEIETLGRRLQVVGGSDVPTRGLKTTGDSLSGADHDAYKKLLKERHDVLERIKGQSLEFAATTTVTTVPAKQIAAGLKKGTALISYFVDKDQTLIWVIHDGMTSAVSVDAGSDRLSRWIVAYREAITSRQGAGASELGQKLSGILIQPIREKIQGVDHLLIVPSRTLHYLPFSSLPLSQERFLIEAHTVNILPNASSLFYLDKKITSHRDKILAMGNPELGRPELSLEFAEREVKSISRHFPKSVVLTGMDAKESLMKEEDLMGTAIIHLAVHGRYEAGQPLKSSLLLAKDQRNDGNLETFEIFSLTMDPRLVVLSACESGLGQVGGGDEVQSLNRAFLYAGAGGVVASLWSVSDESTFKFMEYFYAGLSTRSPADALKSAQVRLMQEHPAPFFWAPFYLTGGMGQ